MRNSCQKLSSSILDHRCVHNSVHFIFHFNTQHGNRFSGRMLSIDGKVSSWGAGGGGLCFFGGLCFLGVFVVVFCYFCIVIVVVVVLFFRQV